MILTLAVSAVLAQEPTDNERYVKWKRNYSRESIVKLKDGALVVRLKTRRKTIDLYRQSGQSYIADRMEQDQFEENQAIVKAFLTQYSFSKVYFIYVEETQRLQNGERSGFFLNDKLKVDSSIVMPESFFMFAEYGPVEGEEYVIPGDTTVVKTYVPGVVIDRGLIVRDANLWQMQDPFPFYVNAMFEKQTEKQVSKLNGRFQNYYSIAVEKLK